MARLSRTYAGLLRGHEVLVVALRLAVLERHTHDLVAGRLRTVPRSLQCDERVALVLGRELLALVEHDVHGRGMSLEQQVWLHRCLDLVGPQLRKARLRMLADIGIGPSVKRTLLNARHEVRHESVAEPVALLHEGIKVSRR